jgi:hypothetical protein
MDGQGRKPFAAEPWRACPGSKGKSPRKREKPQKMDYSGTRKKPWEESRKKRIFQGRVSLELMLVVSRLGTIVNVFKLNSNIHQ